MSENKQRLTMLKRREEAAADTGGALDDRVDERALMEVLTSNKRFSFDADAIIETIRTRVGWCRMLKEYEDIPQREIIEQGKNTVSVIAELMKRLDNMHPNLQAGVDLLLWRKNEEFLPEIIERIRPDLMFLSAALVQVVGTMPDGKAGRPRQGERDRAYCEVYEVVRKQSQPPMPVGKARDLAARLLAMCGVNVPKDDRERIIQQQVKAKYSRK